MKKRLLRYERMNNPSYIHKTTYKVKDHVINVTTQEIDETTHRVKHVSKYVTRENDDLKQYKVSDFYLDNLQLAGAVDNLKTLSLSRDSFSAAAHCAAVADKIVSTEQTTE